MKTQFRKQPAVARGFTIVEVLTVIAILAILGGIGFGTFMLINKNSKIEQAKVMVQNVAKHIEIEANEIALPDGDGSETSTAELYKILSGDTDGSGTYEEGEGSAVIPEMSPQYEGAGAYAKEIDGEWVLVDPWQQPLRYVFPGDKNNAEGGFDLWSIGPDETDDGTTNPDGDDGGLDNINSW